MDMPSALIYNSPKVLVLKYLTWRCPRTFPLALSHGEWALLWGRPTLANWCSSAGPATCSLLSLTWLQFKPLLVSASIHRQTQGGGQQWPGGGGRAVCPVLVSLPGLIPCLRGKHSSPMAGAVAFGDGWWLMQSRLCGCCQPCWGHY